MRATVGEQDVPSYQECLRRLGAWLDAASARCVAVKEGNNGFTVRYERHDIDTVFMQRFFSYQEVLALRGGDFKLRRTLLHRIRKLQGLGGEPGGYQDLFRALGYTLDVQSACQVQLVENEPDGKLVIAYQTVDPGPHSAKPITILGPEEREELRLAAHARRRRRGLLGRLG